MSHNMFCSEVELGKFLCNLDIILEAFQAITDTSLTYDVHTSPSGVKILAFSCPVDYTTRFLKGEFQLVSSEVVDFISTKANPEISINKVAVELFENLSDDLNELLKNKPSYNSGKWQRPLNYSYGQNNKWYQSPRDHATQQFMIQPSFKNQTCVFEEDANMDTNWKNTKIKGRKEGKEDHAFFEKRKMKADSKILVCIFARKFRALAEILGLMRSDGIEIQRCYLDYLEALVSHYKAARSSRNPTGGYEGIRRFEDYHGDGNMDGSLAAKEKGRVEHFGITLKEEEEGKHKLMHTSYCQ
ncbi:hypothetical protein Tco_0162273 [Tanacetum coccineum]